MPASYPSSIAAFATHNDTTDTIFAADVNTPNGEIVAIETGLLNGFQHALKPQTDNTYDLGDATHTWRNFYIKGSFIGDLLFTDATYDIGKAGATRPRDGFFSRNLTVGGNAAVTGTLGVTGTTTLGTVSAGAVTVTSLAGVTGLPVLLHAGSGTNAAAGATNVDTVAISGLTALDTLMIYVSLESITAGTADPQIYNVTDSQKWIDVFLDTAPNIPANGSGSMAIVVRQKQSSSTGIMLFNYGLDVSNIFTGDWNRIVTTTAWTGSFTLALRHTGVTATGTFRYNWAVYKIPGQ